MPDAIIRINRIIFRNFKALADFSLSLRDVNLLVGPNNSGKSTIISALRVLDNGVRFARTRAPTQVFIGDEAKIGYRLPEDSIPISLENIHTNYDATESRVTFQLSNQNKLHLIFPADGGCILLPEVPYHPVLTAAAFKRHFPLVLTVVPVLGPLEHREARREKSTVAAALSSHRASGISEAIGIISARVSMSLPGWSNRRGRGCKFIARKSPLKPANCRCSAWRGG
jgi:hypothetical protein